MGGLREKHEPTQRQAHSAGQRVGLRLAIRIPADDRLQDRGGHLKSERDQTDLDEAEVEARLEERVNRRDERLDGVVEEMRKADREENREDGGTGRMATRGGLALGKMSFGDGRRHDEEQKLCDRRANVNHGMVRAVVRAISF